MDSFFIWALIAYLILSPSCIIGLLSKDVTLLSSGCIITDHSLFISRSDIDNIIFLWFSQEISPTEAQLGVFSKPRGYYSMLFSMKSKVLKNAEVVAPH